ncbi:MAG: dephospho-CoA kinase [Clostridia bacterium]|nr:dephospho-CoA kinase [Clostridia bacterium]
MSRTKIIGLTGGIGSGKSTAAAFFREHGVPTLDADVYARAALEPGTESYAETVALFGPDVVRADGTLDRGRIAGIVFAEESLRLRLNGIVHPYVQRRMREDTERLDAPLIVWEVPLLFESGFDRFCDRTAAILCDEAVRAARIVARDGGSMEQAYARIRAQITDAERAALATDTIENNGDPEAMRQRLEELLSEWKENL